MPFVKSFALWEAENYPQHEESLNTSVNEEGEIPVANGKILNFTKLTVDKFYALPDGTEQGSKGAFLAKLGSLYAEESKNIKGITLKDLIVLVQHSSGKTLQLEIPPSVEGVLKSQTNIRREEGYAVSKNAKFVDAPAIYLGLGDRQHTVNATVKEILETINVNVKVEDIFTALKQLEK